MARPYWLLASGASVYVSILQRGWSGPRPHAAKPRPKVVCVSSLVRKGVVAQQAWCPEWVRLAGSKAGGRHAKVTKSHTEPNPAVDAHQVPDEATAQGSWAQAAGASGRGARLRWPSGVHTLAESAGSRPERKDAVTVTR